MMQWTSRLLLLCCLLGLTFPVRGEEAVEKRLEALQRSRQVLRTDPERRTYRHHWENLIHKLEKLVSDPPAPDPKLDARVRYTLGTVWRDLYDQSRNKRDLQPGADIFAGCVRLYPDSPLADDALYQLGEIQSKLGQTEAARDTLLRVLREYPDGNRIDEAQFLLNSLPGSGADTPAAVGTSSRAGAAGEGTGLSNQAALDAPAAGPTALDAPAAAPTALGAPSVTPAERTAGSEASAGAASTGGGGDRSAAAPPRVPSSAGGPEASPPLAPPLEGAGAEPGVSVSELSAIKVWTNPDYTRLVLHMTGRAAFTQQLSPAEPAGAGPATLVITLPATALAAAFESTLTLAGEEMQVPASGGLLEGVSIRRGGQGGVILTLSLQNLKSYRVTPFTGPDRILVDLFGEALAPETEADPLEQLVMRLPADGGKTAKGKGGGNAAPRYVIVIDPGHGGEDPGAIGPTGAMEKDVVLAIALKVKKKLSTLPGVRVIMTREKDVFIPLESRAAVANRHKADLFISIHANASPKEDNRGLETYYLDTASDAAAEKLAARENALLGSRSDLAFILQDLVIEGNVRYSRRLAQSVHQALLDGLRKKYPAKTVRDLGVKTALFYVLFGAQMPSILVETAFISNGLEAARLTTPAYQNQIAEAVKAGVQRYTEETRTLSRAGE